MFGKHTNIPSSLHRTTLFAQDGGVRAFNFFLEAASLLF